MEFHIVPVTAFQQNCSILVCPETKKAAIVDPGGDIFIHGQPNGVGRLATLPWDWTAGCIAVSDAEIEKLWSITPIGTPVEILP